MTTGTKIAIGIASAVGFGLAAYGIYYSAPHVKKWLAERKNKKDGLATTNYPGAELSAIMDKIAKAISDKDPNTNESAQIAHWKAILISSHIDKNSADNLLQTVSKAEKDWTPTDKMNWNQFQSNVNKLLKK